MQAHCLSKAQGGEGCRTDVIAPRRAGLSFAFDGGFDHGDGGQPGEAGFIGVAAVTGQPIDGVADDMTPGLDPAMAFFGLAGDVDLCRRCVDEVALDLTLSVG